MVSMLRVIYTATTLSYSFLPSSSLTAAAAALSRASTPLLNNAAFTSRLHPRAPFFSRGRTNFRKASCSFSNRSGVPLRPQFPRLTSVRFLSFSNEEPDGSEASSMANLYREWTLSQDKLLYENIRKPLPYLASLLGRGLRGVQSRIDKLSDVNSLAYQRLFTDNKSHSEENPSNDDDEHPTKSSSRLTPVKEVLRRIRWDGTLPQGDFSITHYDRVADDVLEVSFTAPNESVKGAEEFFVFAIPEHRILAVKYLEKVVWDKEQRKDCVFGSMNGNGETIDEVIGGYEGWKREADEKKELNRRQIVEVQSHIKMVLDNNESRISIFKEESKNILERSSGEEILPKKEVERYARVILKLFRDSLEENPILSQTTTIDDCADLFSQYAALLPDESLREQILAEIDILGGVKSKSNDGLTVQSANNNLPELNEDELEESFVRGSGAGGQKINKTNSKVVLLHVPTQLRVECQDTRSLQQNRKIARKRLRMKLDDFLNGKQSRNNVKAAKAAQKKSRKSSKNKRRLRKKKEMEDDEVPES